jgi:ketosteroid isomerase-like protein
LARASDRKERAVGAEQNIDTVKAMYEAFGRGDVDAVLDRCTDDVDWSTDAAIEAPPWYQVAYVRSAEDTALVASALA